MTLSIRNFCQKFLYSGGYIKFLEAGRKSHRSASNGTHEHPVVEPHVSHFMQVPLRTSVKFWHSPQASPS